MMIRDGFGGVVWGGGGELLQERLPKYDFLYKFY